MEHNQDRKKSRSLEGTNLIVNPRRQTETKESARGTTRPTPFEILRIRNRKVRRKKKSSPESKKTELNDQRGKKKKKKGKVM